MSQTSIRFFCEFVRNFAVLLKFRGALQWLQCRRASGGPSGVTVQVTRKNSRILTAFRIGRAAQKRAKMWAGMSEWRWSLTGCDQVETPGAGAYAVPISARHARSMTRWARSPSGARRGKYLLRSVSVMAKSYSGPVKGGRLIVSAIQTVNTQRAATAQG
jgi:hypothetical protein